MVKKGESPGQTDKAGHANRSDGTQGFRAECRKCGHYYVTWDGKHPKGCRYYGFKSQSEPSLAVYESSGEPCKAFTLKGRRR